MHFVMKRDLLALTSELGLCYTDAELAPYYTELLR